MKCMRNNNIIYERNGDVFTYILDSPRKEYQTLYQWEQTIHAVFVCGEEQVENAILDDLHPYYWISSLLLFPHLTFHFYLLKNLTLLKLWSCCWKYYLQCLTSKVYIYLFKYAGLTQAPISFSGCTTPRLVLKTICYLYL